MYNFKDLTRKQKALIKELRHDRALIIKKGDWCYELWSKNMRKRLLNTQTVEALIKKKFLQYDNPYSSQLKLAPIVK